MNCFLIRVSYQWVFTRLNTFQSLALYPLCFLINRTIRYNFENQNQIETVQTMYTPVTQSCLFLGFLLQFWSTCRGMLPSTPPCQLEYYYFLPPRQACSADSLCYNCLGSLCFYISMFLSVYYFDV